MSLLSVLLWESGYTLSRAEELEHLAYAMGGIMSATSYKTSRFPTVFGAESRATHELPSRSENGKLEKGRSWERS